MLAVMILAAVLWWGGAWAGVARGPRVAVLTILLAAVLLAQLVLPAGHGLRTATGDGIAGWLMLGGVVAVFLGYRALLTRLRDRARVADTPEVPAPRSFTGTELNR